LINFERACILAELGASIDSPINICIEKIKNGQIANLNYLVKFHDWLSLQPKQQSNAIAARTWMFKPEIVRHALIDFRRGTPERHTYVSYLTTNRHLHLESAVLFIQYEDDNPIVINGQNCCIDHRIDRKRSSFQPRRC
jgi:hypothetical protein